MHHRPRATLPVMNSEALRETGQVCKQIRPSLFKRLALGTKKAVRTAWCEGTHRTDQLDRAGGEDPQDDALSTGA